MGKNETKYCFTDIEPRPINNFKKNVILVGGSSNIGKTNLCKSLYGENLGYISLDKFNYSNVCNIDEIQKIIDTGNNIDGYPFEFIILRNLDKYVPCLIKNIKMIPKETILIDGSLCKENKFREFFKSHSNYNIWYLTKYGK